MRSFTKILAIPGLRLGYLVADGTVIRELRALLPPWSVNHLAQRVGLVALQNGEAFFRRTREMVREQREVLSNRLSELGPLRIFPSHANFLLVEMTDGRIGATELAKRLLQQDQIAIRTCGNYEGLDGTFFRVAVRNREENDRLHAAIRNILCPSRRISPRRHRSTPALMFQGTSSDAGKSVLTAALCRILLQDGYCPAPFKAQNMSLNSFATLEGGEMGRAQVTQAQACQLDPDVRMNPVLLKPNSDTGSQVVVCGNVVGNMNVGEYVRYKPTVVSEVKKAYDSLAAEHDVMVLEGAGSPAEVNLRSHDIVNMAMARHADAQVVLVGDIDRGGVFASLIGTMEVLAPWERALVTGYVLNRFRGQEDLLDSALDFTHVRTGKPVLGVVPFLYDLGLPEEDSVVLGRPGMDPPCPAGEFVEIAVLHLPHMSNFTDFDALSAEPDTCVRFVKRPAELGRPDVLVVPGSKNVLADLADLRAQGWIELLHRLAEAGATTLVGICGGFQLMGDRIRDPDRIESRLAEATGLGLLPVHTTMKSDKTLTQTSACHLASGATVRGYEIHHGETEMATAEPMFQTRSGAVLGVQACHGMFWGTYLHGVFDDDRFRRWFLDEQRQRKGLAPLGAIQRVYDLEDAFNRLADVVRSRLDVKTLYRRIGL
jgi:cobyric acid synthase CobQ